MEDDLNTGLELMCISAKFKERKNSKKQRRNKERRKKEENRRKKNERNKEERRLKCPLQFGPQW